MRRAPPALLAVPLLLALAVAVPGRAAPLPPQPRAVPVEDASGGHALDHFRAALARTARREAGAITRIAVLGDSHIACDLFTGALRRRLQARYGDAGHGFVLLGSAWSLYQPLDVTRGSSPAWKTARLRARDTGGVRAGLGGAVSRAAATGARTWVGTAPGGPVGHAASRFELLYERGPGGGALAVRLDGQARATLSTDAPAIAAARHVLEAPDGAHTLEVAALDDRPVAVFGAVLERSGPGVVVDDLGVPGLAAPHLAQNDPALLAEQLAARSPDLVVHAFGTNDVRWEGIDLSTYRATVTATLRRLRAAAPRASCLVLGPIDRRHRESDGPWAASLDDVIARQRGAAADAGCAFWDQRAVMGGPGSMQAWMAARPRLTLRDGVHLAARGYDALAGAWIEAVVGASSRPDAARNE